MSPTIRIWDLLVHVHSDYVVFAVPGHEPNNSTFSINLYPLLALFEILCDQQSSN